MPQVTTVRFRLGSLSLRVRLGAYLSDSKNSWEISRHSNAEYELHIVRRGVCRFEADAASFRLAERDAILIGPGIFHGPSSLSDGFERFSLPFSVQASGQDPLPAFLSRPYLLFRSDEAVDRICAMIFAEIDEALTYRLEALTALFSLLLARVFRLLGDTAAPPAAPAEELDWRTQRIDGFFERHLTEYGTEDQLAELLHLSRRQLSRILWEQYGMSFRQKLVRTRMDRAAYLLRTTDLTVGDVGARVGYSSATAFFKAFRAQYGCTPLQYRKANT